MPSIRLLIWPLLVLILASAGARAGITERDVVFPGHGGVRLAGTLTLPESPAGPVPAVLLIQGSGPTDRNGNQGPHFQPDLLRQLAGRLARAGIASLRYDKRGMHANGASIPEDKGAWPAFFAWEAFAGDAAAAYRFLGGQPGIATARTGILGHSEGGMFGLDVVSRGDVTPKVLVLLAAPGRPMGEVIPDQLRSIMARQNAPEAVRADIIAADRRVRAAILETGTVPAAMPAGIRRLYPDYLGPYLRAFLSLHPADALAKVPVPVLAVIGTADTQVSAERDGAALAKALAGRTDGSALATPAGVSHNLKAAAPGEPGIDGPIAEPAVRDLLAWLAAHL